MNLEKLSGVELGREVNAKRISPCEVIDYFEKRISRRNPSINAFVYTKFDEAREEAKILENRLMKGECLGPLAGVPVALKDFLPSKKGWTSSHGGVKSFVTVDDSDSAFYAAAKRCGAIAVGKTNSPSFGFRGTCDNKMYGATSTPFNVSRNSGGSSGGSASAVSDGLVYAAEGGDAGGSIRIPASWCGCFGFKPSAGAIPSVCRPDAWAATHPYCCSGPLSRTVEDAAVILNEMVGFDLRDPLSVPLCFDDFRLLKDKPFKKLRLGLTMDFGVFPTPCNEIVSAIENAVKQFEKCGVEIKLLDFQIKTPREKLERTWLRSICIDTALDLHILKEREGTDLLEDHLDELPEEFAEWNREALKSSMLDYREFHEIRTELLDAHLKAFEDCDLIVSPVTGCLPVENKPNGNTKGPLNISNESVDPLIGFAYTYLENMTGFPAASVPVGVSKENLPIGMQVIGKRYRDPDVIRFSYMIEKLMPWGYEIPYRRFVD